MLWPFSFQKVLEQQNWLWHGHWIFREESTVFLPSSFQALRDGDYYEVVHSDDADLRWSLACGC